MRSDDVGMWWQDLPTAGRGNFARPQPPIPDTGWRCPEEYPDLSGATSIAIDLETHDPELKERGPGVKRDGYIAGIAVAVSATDKWYFPIAHKLGGNLPTEHVLNWAKTNLTRSSQPKLGANILYDLEYLAQAGVNVEGPFWDVQVAQPLLDELQLTYNLDSILMQHLGIGKQDDALYEWCAKAYGGKASRGDQADNIWRSPVQLVGPYAEGDVAPLFATFEKQKTELEAQGLWDIFTLESDLIPLLLAMRRRGVRVDVAAAEQFEDEANKEVARLTKDLGGINVNSSEDLVRLCRREGIQHPVTDKGNPSFVKEWLANNSNAAMRKVTEVRSLMKLRDTFVKGYILGHNINGRIYSQFNQLRSDSYGTVSGRFSSSNPNLQNIPKRTKLGKLIRAMFLPDLGDDWDRFDWSQIEFRLLTHYALGQGAEEARQQYINDPKTDFHQMVCDMINKVIPFERDPAKNINFGFVYGMGVPLLAAHLGLSEEAAEPILTGYHKAVPFVRHTYNKASKRAQQRGYIVTIGGRRRRFPDGEHTHKALNGIMQGGAGDIMKKAMVMGWKAGVWAPDVLGAPLVTVHDELGNSKPRTKAADEATAELKHIMETCVKLKVPLMVEHDRGPSWGELTKVGG